MIKNDETVSVNAMLLNMYVRVLYFFIISNALLLYAKFTFRNL
jgi:hypothetical protein